MRNLVAIKDPSAPHDYRFPIELPPGAILLPQKDGGVAVVGADSRDPSHTLIQLARVNAPWAKDATGRRVPTRYRTEGNSIVQTVNFSSSSSFPVIADPGFSAGWFVYIRFNKSEVRGMANSPGAAFVTLAMAIVCAKLPWVTVVAGCAAAIAAQYASLYSQMKEARNARQCVEWKMTWVGVLSGWKRYNC